MNKSKHNSLSYEVPISVLKGFPYIVYHWTLKKHLKNISICGLRKNSFVTQNPANYKGNVLLGVLMDKQHDWNKMSNGEERPDSAKWQAILPEIVPPSRLFIIKTKETNEHT